MMDIMTSSTITPTTLAAALRAAADVLDPSPATEASTAQLDPDAQALALWRQKLSAALLPGDQRRALITAILSAGRSGITIDDLVAQTGYVKPSVAIGKLVQGEYDAHALYWEGEGDDGHYFFRPTVVSGLRKLLDPTEA